MASYEKVFGQFHPSVANTMSSLGDALSSLGNVEAARVRFEASLKVCRAILGNRHVLTAEILGKLGGALARLGNQVGAREAVVKSYEIADGLDASYHPRGGLLISNLGGILADLAEWELAKRYLERALSMLNSVHGGGHVYVANTSRKLGEVYEAIGEHSTAESYFSYDRDMILSLFGRPDPNPRTSGMFNIERCFAYREYRHRAAEALYWGATEIATPSNYHQGRPRHVSETAWCPEQILSEPSKPLRVTEVFRYTGLPTYTYVPPPFYKSIKADIEQPGAHIVVQGPSGTGKTSLVIRILKELGWEMDQNFRMLTCGPGTGYEHQLELAVRQAMEQNHPAINLTIVDDFHLADPRLKALLGNSLKTLTDWAIWHEQTPKFAVVGIPTSGESLLREASDLSSRLGIYTMGPATDSDLRTLVEKGSQALNVLLDSVDDIVAESDGSLLLCQRLCREICLKGSVYVTCERLTRVRVEIHEAKKDLDRALDEEFKHVAMHFAKGLSWRPRSHKMYLHILLALKNIGKTVIPLHEVVPCLPDECRDSLYSVLDRLPSLLCGKVDHRKYIFFDPQLETFVLDDFLFRRHLHNMDEAALLGRLGLTSDSPRRCHEFPFEVGFSFTCEARPLAQHVNEVLKREDVITWFDADRQKFLLGRNLEKHLKDVFSVKCRYYLVFLEQMYGEKGWTTVERVAMTSAGRNDHIIPVVLEEESSNLLGIPSDLLGHCNLSTVWSRFRDNNALSNDDIDLIKSVIIRPTLELLS